MEQLHITKEKLVELLEAKRDEARAYDQESARRHKEAEKAWHKKTKEQLREMSKLPYGELQEAIGKSRWWGDDAPNCPRLQEPAYTRTLERLAIDTRAKFIISQDKANGTYWRLLNAYLSHEPAPPQTVCS